MMLFIQVKYLKLSNIQNKFIVLFKIKINLIIDNVECELRYFFVDREDKNLIGKLRVFRLLYNV